MQRANRQEAIISAARQPGGAKVSDLAAAFEVSAMTVRRDLDELQAAGLVRRTHGRVVAASPRGQHVPYALRSNTLREEKARIGERAATLIPAASSVIIDDGSTCEAVARSLSGREMTVLALSLPGAAALSERSGTLILTPGGVLDPEELSWRGARVVQEVGEFLADVAVIGVCALDIEHGVTATSAADAEVKRAVLQTASRVVAVATGDKVGQTGTFRVAVLEMIDALVTTPLPAATAASVRAAGVELIEV